MDSAPPPALTLLVQESNSLSRNSTVGSSSDTETASITVNTLAGTEYYIRVANKLNNNPAKFALTYTYQPVAIFHVLAQTAPHYTGTNASITSANLSTPNILSVDAVKDTTYYFRVGGTTQLSPFVLRAAFESRVDLPLVRGIIASEHYNRILANIEYLMESYYGNNALSSPVSADNDITISEWSSLLSDLNKCVTHQTGNTTAINLHPNYATLDQTNQLIRATETALLNRNSAHPTRFVTTVINDSITTPWVGNNTCEYSYTWSSAASAQCYFNTRSNLSFSLQTQLLDSDYYSLKVNKFLNLTVSSAVGNLKINRENYQLTDSFVVTSSDSSMSATISHNFNGSTLRVRIELNVGLDRKSVAVIINCAMHNAHSNGGGIAAPLPVATVSQSLASGVGAATAVKTLEITGPDEIALNVNTPSITSIYTVTNTGNTSVGIANVYLTKLGNLGVTLVNPAPITLAPTQSTSTRIVVTGSTPGVYSNKLVVVSNTEQQFDVKPVQVTVFNKYWDFTTAPDSINWGEITDLAPRTATLYLNPVPSSVAITNTSVELAGSDASSFTVQWTNDQVTVGFNPNGKPNRTHSAILNITANRVTHSVPVTVVKSVTGTYHLGSWISAAARDNSIAGFSLDILDGVRYLTVGIGCGTDGMDSVGNGARPSIQALGQWACAAPYQSIMYKAASNPLHCEFLKTYGVWARPNGATEPINQLIEYEYSVEFPAAGTYKWEFSSDNEGEFGVNGTGRLNAGHDLTTSEVGAITLNYRGAHTVRIAVVNRHGPGSIALRFTTLDDIEVWSTLRTVRPSTSLSPYSGWAEVYRIPITQTGIPHILGNYAVKENQYLVGKWSKYWHDTSPFVVIADSLGGVAVSAGTVDQQALANQPTSVTTTVASLSESLNYWASSPNRLTQLGPTGSQTLQFTGFDYTGAVQTRMIQST